MKPSTNHLLGGCAFTSMASMRACDSLLPALANDFSSSVGKAAASISVFALAYGLLQLFYGPMGDRFGKLRVIGLATVLCTVGNASAALAPDLDWLIASRAVSGAAAAGIIPLTMAWIGDQSPYEDRQAVLAQLLAATVSSMISGQWNAGVVGDVLGWRTAFAILATMFLAFGALLLAQTRAGEVRSAPSAPAGLVRNAATTLRLPWSRRILVITFLEGVFAFGALAFIPVYLQVRFGLSMSAAGAVAALYGLGGLIYSAFARKLVIQFREPGLARLGGNAMAVALAGVAGAPTWWVAAPACLAAGFGFYALHNTLQTSATQMMPGARGTAMALFASCLFLGQSIGISMAVVSVNRASQFAVFSCSAIALLLLGNWFSHQLRERNALCVA